MSYLTYDPWYRDSHEREHILSTPERPIIELVYSPLPGTGGVWHYEKHQITRKVWLERMSLSERLNKKIWIPIFVYPETLSNLDLKNIPEHISVFLLGTCKIVRLRHSET